jgi:hypothetical protein
MRRISEMMSNPDAKQKMVGIVETYERLARQAEQHLADDRKRPG